MIKGTINGMDVDVKLSGDASDIAIEVAQLVNHIYTKQLDSDAEKKAFRAFLLSVLEYRYMPSTGISSDNGLEYARSEVKRQMKKYGAIVEKPSQSTAELEDYIKGALGDGKKLIKIEAEDEEYAIRQLERSKREFDL